jgi:hypothetical protein
MKITLKRAKVALNFEEQSGPELLTSADATVLGLTGSTTFTALPVPLPTVTSQTTALRTTVTQITAGNTSETLTALQTQQANTLMLSLATNGHNVEDIANTVAAGNLEKAKQLILSSGYNLKKETAPHPRSFEVVESGPGWVHVRDKKASIGAEGNIWRFGITTAKNVPPNIVSLRFNLEVDIIISDFPSGTILAIQHASVLPVGHKTNTGTSATISGSHATSLPASAAKHTVFSNIISDPYTWTDFLYVVIP